MAEYTCSKGHRWEPGEQQTAADGLPFKCPVCGESVSASELPTLVKEQGQPLTVSLADERAAGFTSATPPITWPTVEGYEILAELGRGGMGVVYKARQLSLNRTVALKMILAGAHAGKDELARFRTEAEAVAQLQHPNIVQIYEVGDYDGQPYIALEFVEGGSLAQRLGGTPQPAHQAAELVHALASAVHFAHQRGIIHRDLKPGNILLASVVRSPLSVAKNQQQLTTDHGQLTTPKITDFGLAKRLEGSLGQTRSGAIMGTPSYMAPEQAGSKIRQVGPATDIYALGVMLYELLTGRPPFRGETTIDTLMQVQTQEPVPPLRLQPKLPRDLDTICLKCLQKEPHKRYPTAEALAEDLRRFLNGEPIQARPISTLERAVKWAQRRPAVAALFAVIGLAATILLIMAMLNHASLEAANIKLQASNRELKSTLEKLEAANEQLKTALKKAEDQQTRAEKGESEAQRLAILAQERMEESRRSLYTLQLTQVANLAGRDPLAVRQVLNDPKRCPEDLRDFTWGYLYRLSMRDRLTLQTHRRGATFVAYSPDGKRIATGGVHEAVKGDADETVKLWDAETGKQIAAFRGHTGTVRAVLFSPDGKTLISGGHDNTVRLWDVDKRELRKTLKVFSVTCLAVSPDGKLLAAGGPRMVTVLDISSGEARFELMGHSHQIRSVAFSPDGKVLASASYDKTVKLWDAATGKERATLKEHPHGAFAVAFEPVHGDMLAVGCGDGTLKLWAWQKNTAEAWADLRGHAEMIYAVAFSPDGRTLASAGDQYTVRLWEWLTVQERTVLRGHAGRVTGLAFSPDGETLASASFDRTVKLWEVDPQPSVATLTGHEASIRSVAHSPDGKLLASGGDDGKVKLWDPVAGEELATLVGHSGRVRAVAFSADGQILASASEDGTVRLWDMATRKERMQPIKAQQGAVVTLAFSPDGKLLATGSGDPFNPFSRFGEVKLWDPATGKMLRSFKARATGDQRFRDVSATVNAVAFSPDSKTLAIAGEDALIRLWSLDVKKEPDDSVLQVVTLKGHNFGVYHLAFSPDGKTLASVSGVPLDRFNPLKTNKAGEVKLWDLQTRQERLSLVGHTGPIFCVTFSPDGRTLATGSADTTIRLWDPVTGQERAVLQEHTDTVRSLAFSRDGKMLASASGDPINLQQFNKPGEIKLWTAATPEKQTRK